MPCGLYSVTSTNTSSSAQQVNDQDHQPHHQQQVDQRSADVQAETQKPQDQQNHKNCPKHGNLLPARKLHLIHPALTLPRQRRRD